VFDTLMKLVEKIKTEECGIDDFIKLESSIQCYYIDE